MRPKLLLSTGLAVLAATLPMPHAGAQISGEYSSCIGRAHGTVQQSICAQTELGKQDARLNKAYTQLMQQYANQPDKKLTLRTEERTWLKKRDYDCNLGRDTTDEGCVMQKTADRADILEHELKF